MVEEVKTFKVFIASPRDCGSERFIVRDIVKYFDTIYFESHKIHISLLGWEDTIAPGGNRPQSEINIDVDDCDLFVLCLYKRWGTKPAESEYTSGSEEEFYTAWGRYEETGSPWIYTFFRIVDEETLADPGEQLMEVIRFKDKIRAGDESFSGKILYKEHYLPEDASEDYHNFEKLINRAIAKWIGDMLDGGGRVFTVGDDNGAPPDLFKSKLADKEKALEEALKKIEELEEKEVLSVSENAKKHALELASVGRTLVGKGNMSEAETVFVKAIEIYPDHADILLGYSDLLYRLGRLEEALRTCERVIGINPDNVSAYYNIGVVLDNIGEHEGAVEAYNKAIELRPDFAGSYFGKGYVLNELGKYEEAIKMLDIAIRLAPDLASAYTSKGYALNGMEKYEEAIPVLDKAIEIVLYKGIEIGAVSVEAAAPYYNKSLALLKLRRSDEALTAVNNAITLNHGLRGAYFNRACAYSLLREKYKMLSDLENAIELDGKFREMAKADEEFNPYRDDPDFRRLVYPEDFKEGEVSG